MNQAQKISGVEAQFLQSLYDYGYLTVKQLVRLHYSPTVVNYAREQLTKLEKKDYIMHTFLSRHTQAGRSPSVYTLANNGIKYLEQTGLDAPSRFRPSEVSDLSYDYLEHTLAINDFLICAALLEKEAPDYPLLEFRHERLLKKEPVYITSQGKKIGVILDSWLKFQLPTGNTLAIGLELDRGTRDVSSFKRKLRHLLAFINGPYQQHFHTQHITIAFAARCKTPDQTSRRATVLHQWTQEVLTEENREDDNIYFFFCALPQENISPTWLFREPSWIMPFDTSAQILIEDA